MQIEEELDNSETVEEVETPETTEETEAEKPQDDNDEKNRMLYERAKRAEARLKEVEEQLRLKDSSVSDPFSDDEELKSEVKNLKDRLARFEEQSQLEAVHEQYPILKEKVVEFDEYRQQNPGMALAVAAKAFLVEHDLLGQPTKRKGLEKAGGGQRTPPSPKMSAEDAKRLRETNYNEYRKQLMAGKIQI